MTLKLLKISAVVLAVAAVVLLAAGFVMVRRLDTPEFHQELRARIETALGTKVRVEKMDLSLFSGVTLEGVGIENPPPFSGDLLTADDFTFRYRLWPLLVGRIDIDRLSLRRPVLALSMDTRGGYNFERLAGATPSSGRASRVAAVPFELHLSRLSVDGGRVSVSDARKTMLLGIEGLDLTSSLRLQAGGGEGRGRIAMARVALGSGVAASDVRAPLVMSAGVATIAPLQARLAEGELTGQIRLILASARFTSDIELHGVDLKALAAQTHARAGFGGRLGAKAKLEGSGSTATLAGRGSAHIDECRVEESRLFGLIAVALRVPVLSHPDLDECRTEFSLRGGRLQTSVLRIQGKALALTGTGTIDLATSSLDYQMNLALASQILSRIPAADVRAAFRDRGDGFGALDFNVSGTTTAPRTDLVVRIGKAAARSKIRGLLERLR